MVVQAITGRTIGGEQRVGPTGKDQLAHPNFGSGSVFLTDLDGIAREAAISQDGRYRYWLKRTWHIPTPAQPVAPVLAFVMLNPSTADADVDDNTIRKCMKYAHREGYGGLMVLNLFAYRATQPKDMWEAEKAGIDIIGPANNRFLAQLGRFGHLVGYPHVVCAWGAHGGGRGIQVAKMLKENGALLVCLAKNKDGSPCHPLYQPDAAPLIKFD